MTENPRFVAFANAHGRTVEQQLAFGESRSDRHCRDGFLNWIEQQLKEACDAFMPFISPDSRLIIDHPGWDRWLTRPGVTRLKDDPA